MAGRTRKSAGASITGCGVRIVTEQVPCSAYSLVEHRLQVNVLATGMLAHLVLADMAQTADEPKVAKKPHMVFLSSDDHYDVEFAQKDSEKLLETLNDPFSYQSTATRPRELSRLADRELRSITSRVRNTGRRTNITVPQYSPYS